MKDARKKSDWLEKLVAWGCGVLHLAKYERILTQVAKFVVTGVIATVIDWAIYYVLVYPIGMDPLIAQVFSFVAATIFNYYSNTLWVFNTTTRKSRRRLVTEFFVISIVALGISEALLARFIRKAGMGEMWAKVVTTAIVMVFNFITRKMFLEENGLREKVGKLLGTQQAQVAINLGASIIGAVGICKFCWIADNAAKFPFNSFLFIVLLGLLYIAYSKRSRELRRGAKILAAILTVIVTAILVLGKQLDLLSRINWTLGTLLTICALGCCIYIVIHYAVDFCERVRLKENLELTRKKKWVIFAVILLSNLLIFLAVMPGVYGWDSSMQAYMFLNNAVNTHYSVLLGAVFGGLLGIGREVFGSLAAGMAIAMGLQMLLMSYIYTKIVCFVAETTKNKALTILTVVFFAGTLIMGLAAVYATQDIIFGGMFALIFIELCNLVRNPDYWKSGWNIAKYIVFGFLLCASRNNGVYALAFVLLVTAIVNIRRWKWLIVMAAPITLAMIYTGPIFGLLGIPNTDSVREMMGVPSQQLARVYVYNRDSLTEEELAKIEEYYEREEFLQYETFTAKADRTKAALDGEAVEAHPLDYAVLWAKVGVKHPRAYIEAFLLNSLGTWYPNKEYNDPRSDIPYIDYEMSRLWSEEEGQYAEMRIVRESLFPAYEEVLANLFWHNKWQEVPLLVNIVSMGTYFVLFVFALGVMIYRKQWKWMIPLGLILGNYIIILLAPVAVFRYCYPMIMVMPIVMGVVMREKRYRQ